MGSFYSKNKIYQGDDGDNIGFQSSTDVLSSQFSTVKSGSFYLSYSSSITVGGKTYLPFSGSFQELRFYKKNLNYTHYRGSISKSGYIITIGNNYETLIYKLNLISNSWEEQPPILTSLNQIPLINNYGISVDKNGFSCAISYIYKLTDTNLLDTIQIKNYYYQFYENKTTFHKDKNKLFINFSILFKNKIIFIPSCLLYKFIFIK